MKISIITVCYNSEKTIAKTIESVLKQKYDNYEYIIIDGLSKDKTVDIIKSYENKFNKKLKYISEKDKGIYDAMNKGIALANGDIIGLINSDDVLADDNIFNEIIDNIKDNDGVYGDLLFVDDLENPVRIFKAGKPSKKNTWHPPHPTLYLKKEVYEKYGKFNLKYKIAADYDFMLRITNKIKLKYIPKFMVYMTAGGISTNGLKGYYKNFKESLQVLKDNNIKLPLIININRIFKTFMQSLKAKNKKVIK